MSWLLDTNVLSELRKGRRCRPGVREWFDAAAGDDLYLSVLVLGEIRRGIELIRKRDRRQALSLDRWLSELAHDHGDRILLVDARVAGTWGRISALRPLSVVDALLASTALVHDLTLVTRNARHLSGTGARVLDPWEG